MIVYRFVLTLFVAALAVSPAAFAQAERYPDHPIKLIVGYAPGGGTDIVARLLAVKVGEDLGQPMVVENRPGASGIIAAGQVAKAKPDGYTLMMGVVSLDTILPNLQPSLPFDPVKDFAPVTLTGSVPHIIVVHPSLPVHSVKGSGLLTPKRIPASSTFLPRATAPRRTSQANCSSTWRASTWCTSRTRAAAVSLPPDLGSRDGGLRHIPLRRPWFARDKCARSPSRATSASPNSRTCRRLRSPASPVSLRYVVRGLRACWNTGGDRQQAACRVQRCDAVSLDSTTAGRDGRRRYGDAFAGGIRGIGEAILRASQSSSRRPASRSNNASSASAPRSLGARAVQRFWYGWKM